jgi:two-component system, cell cycle response regulator
MKILVAEDDPVARCRLEESLREWGYEVLAVANGVTASRMLQASDSPQLALLDWMLPERDGPQLCRDVRSRTPDGYIYIILLTSKAHTEEIAAAFEAGADDYLIKPFEMRELQARLLAGQRIVKLQDDLIGAREAMRHQATHDSLTGAWNRYAILESLDRELQRAQREGGPVSVLLADLDHFKHINDTLGHPAGDAVLKEVVERMMTGLRPYDLIGRYGGEEFLIVLPGVDANDAWNLAERLRLRMAAEPVHYAKQPINLTMSLGVARCGNGEPGSAIDLLSAADQALYQAKESGRNRVAKGAPASVASGSTLVVR